MSMGEQRILYVASSWPLGRTFGGQLRALHVGRALQQVGRVTLAVVSSEVDDREARRQTEEAFGPVTTVCPGLTPNRGPIQKLRWALDAGYMNVHGVSAAPAERERVITLAAQHDLTWMLNARTPNILQQWHWPRAHLDLDDVPSTYLRSAAEIADSWVLPRLRNRIQGHLFRRRELRFKERFSTLSVCSESDRHYLGDDENIHVIPNGFARPASEPVRAPVAEPPRLGFIGLMTYAPNLAGVRWFLRECWPGIRQQIPGIQFRLAGRGSDVPDLAALPGVHALGWIDDPASEIASWSAMVIPIQMGGGTRIKIADAFSRKCPVVSTRFGAHGYQVEDRRELMLAGTAAEMVGKCVELIRQPEAASRMADRAWTAFLEKWTWEAIAPRVWAAVEDCCRRANGARV